MKHDPRERMAAARIVRFGDREIIAEGLRLSFWARAAVRIGAITSFFCKGAHVHATLQFFNDITESAAVKTQRPIATDDEHRVLQFRPRHSVQPRVSQTHAVGQPRHDDGEPLDLTRYEQAREQPDDFRHRMLANIAAFAFTVALLAIGIWLAVSISDMRKTQDCVSMGRRDCARIITPQD
jgi:hypothetical protein